jgi:hypothetical protein
MVSFMSLYPSVIEMCRSQSQSEHYGKERGILRMPRIEIKKNRLYQYIAFAFGVW